MGRRPYSSRLTTNQCKSISVKFLKKNLYFYKGGPGEINWTHLGEKSGGIGFSVFMIAGNAHIRLSYTRTDRFSGEKSDLDYTVRLSSTPCYFGGKRWWFLCPLIEDEQPCNRRVGLLYLGGGKYFGCRHCYNLTYASSKSSHRFDGFLGALIQKIQHNITKRGGVK
jgi:hypothetical protein